MRESDLDHDDATGRFLQTLRRQPPGRDRADDRAVNGSDEPLVQLPAPRN
jgi:hypothetical protein